LHTQKPIGFFDSGIGGTSIWKEVTQLLPRENSIFLADGKNAPYGEKSKELILDLCKKNVDLLLEKGSKIIVVACNTATTNAVSFLRRNYNVPFIGIEPAIKPAALGNKTGTIGVLATRGTLSSKLFSTTQKLHASKLKVIEQHGDGIVNLIEDGKLHSTEMENLLIEYTKKMVEENIDHLVLGCTHYPYLIPILKNILPKNIQIIDSGYAVAMQTERVLIKNNLKSLSKEQGSHQFYSNRDANLLKGFVDNKNLNIAVNYLDF